MMIIDYIYTSPMTFLSPFATIGISSPPAALSFLQERPKAGIDFAQGLETWAS